MPLRGSVSTIIKKLLKEGKPRKQAVAIALNVKGKSKKKRKSK